jgi:hypothetical protein
MASYSKEINDALKEKMTPTQLREYEQSNEKYGMVSALEKINELRSAQKQGFNLTPQDLALLTSGSRYGLTRDAAKLLSFPNFTRKLGLGIDELGSKIKRVAPYTAISPTTEGASDRSANVYDQIIKDVDSKKSTKP